ncbi:hypothetical protein DFH08DRAFT_948169 [Mycena albidolilacea]|uniref:Uncharacterized protein n=1 Tax=Mycena albidolilacea TaxID=1033008 RepID=A0AAD7AQH4_9AGAR|nr:hypothetical protein DFH08DRAFT_948169 [Mycena albidolilacea]
MNQPLIIKAADHFLHAHKMLFSGGCISALNRLQLGIPIFLTFSPWTATSPSFIWGLFVRELFETSAAIILYGLYVNLSILAMYTLFATSGLPGELGCWRRPGFSSGLEPRDGHGVQPYKVRTESE